MPLRELGAIVLGSSMFVGLKTLLVWLLERTASPAPWLNYLVVTLSVTLLGWVYHSKISFRVPLDRGTLVRYLHQALWLKALDYGLYLLLVYFGGVHLVWAVLVAGGLVFLTRVVVYFRYVFPSSDPRRETSDDS